jgi:hypothetical protein
MFAVYTGIPLADIRVLANPDSLRQSYSEALARGPATYVIDLCQPGVVTSPGQRDLEGALDDGSIPAQRVQIGGTRLWVVARTEPSAAK